MIAAFLLSQALAPALPVFDSGAVCARDASCLARESGALERLRESWPDQPESARAHCAARAIAGEITQYAGLEACLVIYRVMGDPGAAETTQARIILAPVSSGRN